MNQTSSVTIEDGDSVRTVGFAYSTFFMFLYQNCLLLFALINYKHYILDSTDAAAGQSPNKNWRNFDFLNMAAYGAGWLLYITNLILDNEGGIIH